MAHPSRPTRNYWCSRVAPDPNSHGEIFINRRTAQTSSGHSVGGGRGFHLRSDTTPGGHVSRDGLPALPPSRPWRGGGTHPRRCPSRTSPTHPFPAGVRPTQRAVRRPASAPHFPHAFFYCYLLFLFIIPSQTSNAVHLTV